ncbi:hypothetical protein M5689_022843 [Euphorbia peplus]|nr:hypothetical protein M5689_022843 [Euphorbia peplus]
MKDEGTWFALDQGFTQDVYPRALQRKMPFERCFFWLSSEGFAIYKSFQAVSTCSSVHQRLKSGFTFVRNCRFRL